MKQLIDFSDCRLAPEDWPSRGELLAGFGLFRLMEFPQLVD